MPRNAFQANRKEEVLHSGRVGPLSPSGKQAETQLVHSKKEKSFWSALTVFSACLPEGERGPTLPAVKNFFLPISLKCISSHISGIISC